MNTIVERASLQNKRIVIVGGTSGMGRATALASVGAGAEVVIASRSAERLQQVQTEIGQHISTASLDTRLEGAVKQFFTQQPPFDHLVISAGEMTEGIGPFLDLDLASARAQFESRFWGPYIVARYGTPKIRDGGSITFFTGIYGEKVAAGASVPSAVHGALERLCRVLAVELAPLRVNVISPGTIATPLHEGMPEEQRAAMYENIAQVIPGRRVGQSEDIAQSILFLMQNSYITGMTLSVDGGARLL